MVRSPLVRSRFTSFDWQDICERCRVVIDMPLDGTPAKHLCLTDPIHWRNLIHSSTVFHRRLDRGVGVRTRIHLDSLGDDDPSQMGPFAPGDPPRPRLVGDLLLWSRSDLQKLGFGRTSIKIIADWLAGYGLSLSMPDRCLLPNFLRSQLAARYGLSDLGLTGSTTAPITADDFYGGPTT